MRSCLILLVATLFAGCGTTPDSVEWRVKPQSNYYARDKAVVFESLMGVLENSGYRITKSAAAAGVIARIARAGSFPPVFRFCEVARSR
jgi:hypothetical protein